MATREDIEDNYMFRVTKRILKKEYPFIVDIKLTDNWDDYKSLYFVDIYFDPIKVFESLNIPPTESNMKYIYRWSRAPYLSLLFSSKVSGDGTINELGKSVDNTITRIASSPSIPPDMRLPRSIDISSWIPIGQSDNT